MPVSQPIHASWADLYDTVYEGSFGSLYNRLTTQTVEWLEGRVPAQGRIIDFGAGTGRITLPLAERGYRLTAVDASSAMLKQLKGKHRSGQVDMITSTIRDFRPDQSQLHDAALCIFTVISYLTREDDLSSSFAVMRSALKPGGHLLIDVPQRCLFTGVRHQSDAMDRNFSVKPTGQDTYEVHQQISLLSPFSNNEIREDRFPVRYWPLEKVKSVLLECGFDTLQDVSDSFSGTGAHYLWVQVAR